MLSNCCIPFQEGLRSTKISNNNRSNAEPLSHMLATSSMPNMRTVCLLLIYVTANTECTSLTAKFRDLVSVENSLQINLIVIVLSSKENLIVRCRLFLQ